MNELSHRRVRIPMTEAAGAHVSSLSLELKAQRFFRIYVSAIQCAFKKTLTAAPAAALEDALSPATASLL